MVKEKLENKIYTCLYPDCGFCGPLHSISKHYRENPEHRPKKTRQKRKSLLPSKIKAKIENDCHQIILEFLAALGGQGNSNPVNGLLAWVKKSDKNTKLDAFVREVVFPYLERQTPTPQEKLDMDAVLRELKKKGGPSFGQQINISGMAPLPGSGPAKIAAIDQRALPIIDVKPENSENSENSGWEDFSDSGEEEKSEIAP